MTRSEDPQVAKRSLSQVHRSEMQKQPPVAKRHKHSILESMNDANEVFAENMTNSFNEITEMSDSYDSDQSGQLDDESQAGHAVADDETASFSFANSLSVDWRRTARSKVSGLSVPLLDSTPADAREIIAQFKAAIVYNMPLYDCIHPQLIVDGSKIKEKWNLHWGGAFANEFSKLMIGCSAFRLDLDFFKYVQLFAVSRRLGEPDPQGHMPWIFIEGEQIDRLLKDISEVSASTPDNAATFEIRIEELLKSVTHFNSHKSPHIGFLDHLRITGRKATGRYLACSDLKDIQAAWDTYARRTGKKSIADGVAAFHHKRTPQNWDKFPIQINGMPIGPFDSEPDHACRIRHLNTKKAWLTHELQKNGLMESDADRGSQLVSNPVRISTQDGHQSLDISSDPSVGQHGGSRLALLRSHQPGPSTTGANVITHTHSIA